MDFEVQKKVKRILIVLIIIVLFSIIFSLINAGNNKILRNIKIQEIDVSKKEQEQAQEDLTKIYNDKKSNQITLSHNDFEAKVSYDQLNVSMDINGAVQKAYGIGRTGNIITNNYTILFSNIISKNINIDTKLDEESLEKICDDIGAKLPDVKKDSTYYIEDENLIIKKGEAGVILNKDKLKQEIKNTIENFKDKEGKIDIPVEKKDADQIDLAQIISEIKKEPQNAYVSQNPKKIHAEQKGIELAVSEEEAKKIISNSEKEEYVIPLKITEPSITVASLGDIAFTDKLAKFTTNYDASNVNRNNNLNLAASKLNGTIVNPGETFSYNKTIGERTISAGFKQAKAYAAGDIVLDVGGGICQLSSTLYNTALLSNLEIVERHNHYFQTSYVEAGRDATVSWGSLDFKFKNNRNYPIRIYAEAENGVVNVEIYGIKEDGDYTVVVDSKVTSIIEMQIQYKHDSSLTKGTEEVERYGEDGCTSETTKTLLKNGIIVSKEVISKDTYNQLTKIVRTNK